MHVLEILLLTISHISVILQWNLVDQQAPKYNLITRAVAKFHHMQLPDAIIGV